ncbi:hypothetical protein ACFOZ5_04320 [Marinobacter lacisalsi]|uniref:Uncharacterized protein n=1 Tax=Marinobacter lacisalsi TaxID=475979 RepID=A0ABV8QFB5_9GAMM
MSKPNDSKDIPPRAGRTEPFPSGKLTFLSPRPLPTGLPPVDHAHAIGEVNDAYLEFGTGVPSAFSWQVTLGLPFGVFIMVAFLVPLIAAALAILHGYDLAKATETFWYMFDYGWWIAVAGGLGALFLGYLPRWQAHGHLIYKVPTRFHRQRREACFVPKGEKEPIVVPWEDLVAWVTEARGVTEYGVQHQYGFGFGFYHPDTGEKYTLEYETYGLAQAISNWEAIRAYMEYEVHTLKEIQDPLDLQGPDDPPWEGVHVFRNARARLHQQYRDGEAGIFYFAGWYLYHVMTFWTIPNRLVEWEANKVKTLTHRAVPEKMAEWSEALPETEWAKPSDELKRLSQKVREKQQAQPSRLPQEVFAEVYAGEGDEVMSA